MRGMCAASNAAAELVHVAATASLAHKRMVVRRMATRDDVTDRPRMGARSNKKLRNADRDGRGNIEQADNLKFSVS